MATVTTTRLVDDVDGSEAVETVRFALDGVTYEIDLSAVNASRLRGALAEFVKHARRTGGRKISGRPAVPTRPDRSGTEVQQREENRAAREWARANGFTVSAKGRIPDKVLVAYRNRDVNKEVIKTDKVGGNGNVKPIRARSTSPRSTRKSATD
jgi:hypothetical protein